MFDSVESLPRAPFVPMPARKKAHAGRTLTAEDRERAARCKRLREALGYPQSAGFAAFLKVSPQRWNHVENGMPLGHELAVKIVRLVPGMSLDWLYFGKPEGLSVGLARLLGELPPGPGNGTTA